LTGDIFYNNFFTMF